MVYLFAIIGFITGFAIGLGIINVIYLILTFNKGNYYEIFIILN